MIDKKKFNNCKQSFNDNHEKYVETNKNMPLDSFLTGDYSLGYSDVYPLTDSLEKILKIKDRSVRFLALKIRYDNPEYPSVDKKNEKKFIKLNLYGSRFLSDHPDWISTYAQISNFIDELVDGKIILNEDSFTIDKNASIGQIISSALSYVSQIFIKSSEHDLKNHINWLAFFSKHKDEFSKLKESLTEQHYIDIISELSSSNSDDKYFSL